MRKENKRNQVGLFSEDKRKRKLEKKEKKEKGATKK